jgi:hypothetical protein
MSPDLHPTAERSLIGAALLSPQVVHDVAELITPDDLWAPEHKLIWQAITEVAPHTRCDVLTVTAWLTERGHTGEAFNIETLLGYQNATPAISNGVAYARQIAAARLRRDLAHAGNEITRLATDATDATDAADRARELVANLTMPDGIGPPDPDCNTFLDTIDYTIDWLIPGMLERGDRMLITAGEGIGKSVLLTQIAVQTAAGVHPWTLQRCPPRNTLIVDCENGARRVARRLDTLIEKVPAEFDPQRLKIIAKPAGVNLTARSDRLWLIDRCRANATELLVIGPAYRLSSGVAQRGDIGGEEHAKAVTSALDECRSRCGVTILMETHAPHATGFGARDLRPFGSSVWLRWPEFGIGIRRDKDDAPDVYTLQHWRGPRDERVWPGELRKGGRWPWTAGKMPNGTFTQGLQGCLDDPPPHPADTEQF